mmetsp:Transcript_19828/g.29428  ORF Transcript_19828/g.29428 Transcript_19828/m.29428 type:complete len:500 (+) Transcript_19828:134-1633(+)|eukprot:CAMPEP_0194200520 /NCGR_PEP_ID=MMETSP0156-20130528/1089_1 /TAXON_ID=33649 /ORGANISM="Thalassionema nitzschioides, Strain L26-B" /LENGTH=499 /DNA_ID=CAMNT_0038925527 /DNA_START=55 /DNA_END=1554 /DNA_ORIENTATION=-
MSSSIPSDPSLVLGNVIDLDRIRWLQDIAQAEAPQNLAQEQLDSMILASRNLEAIYTEMANMKVDEEDLEKIGDEQEKLRKEMSKAAVELGNATIAATSITRQLRSQRGQNQINFAPNSPLDWTASQIKKLAIANDSMSMDVQYFRNEDNKQGSGSHAQTISSFVMDATKGANTLNSNKNTGKSARENVTKQTQNHRIEGTIVITANCTHRNAQIIDPFVMDPVKALGTWNEMFPDDPLETRSADMFRIALDPEARARSAGKNVMQILSGASYGSSFVGMVHILEAEKTDTSQKAEALADDLKDAFTNALATREQAGDYGVGEEFAKSAKNLASTSDLSNHCTIITEGIIANLASNTMKTTVANMAPNPQDVMGQLAAIQAASDQVTNDTMEAMATKAKTGQQFIKLNSEYMKNTVSALGSYDNDANMTIDMNSLMACFTDFISKAAAGDCGVPINFFLRDIYEADIADAYIRKYFPNGAADQKRAMRGAIGLEGKGEE